MAGCQGKAVYTINLDELDLATFPVTRNTTDTGLLWRVNNRDDDYYHFNLEMRTSGPDFASTNHPTFVAYTCQICNLKIPLAFMTEHMRSVKHRTFLDITNKALERAKNNMNQAVCFAEALTDPTVYYCSSCSVVLKKIDKKAHDNSKAHNVSKLHDKMLKDLATLYTDDNQLLDSNEFVVSNQVDSNDVAAKENNSNKPDAEKCPINRKLNTKKSTISNNEVFVSNPNCDNKIFKAIDTTNYYDTTSIKKSIDNSTLDISECKNNTSMTTSDYICMLKERYKENYLFQKVEYVRILDSIKMQAVNGEIAYIKVKNYFGDNDAGCALCGLELCHFETHAHTQNHIKRLIVPIQDLSCLRKFPSSGHCLICNEYIPIEYVPIHEHLHRRKEDTDTKNIGQVTNTEGASEAIQNEISINKNKNIINLQKYPDIESVKNDRLRCKVCNIFVTKSEITVREHFLGKNHKSNKMALEKNTSKAKESAARKMPKKENIKEYKEHKIKRLPTGLLLCEACLVNIPDGDISVRDHVDGKKHRKNVFKIDFPDLEIIPIQISFAE